MRSVFWWLAVIVFAIPFVCGAINTLLITTAGFGGGHGRFDSLIYDLGRPATAFIEKFPTPKIVEKSGLLLIVWYPALLNFVAIWGPIAFILFLISRFVFGKNQSR